MRQYKFPKWLKRFYPKAIWDFSFKSGKKKVLYLTFDDGPNPSTTPWLLDLLQEHQAKATFFCIGKNANDHPELLKQLERAGHRIGNHSYSHPNGLKSNTEEYIKDIIKAERNIKSHLFRPPYGKMTPRQHKILGRLGYKTIFWSHIAYDFDKDLPATERMSKTIDATKPGAVMVFHDSDKAFPQLKNELPELLKKWQGMGYTFTHL